MSSEIRKEVILERLDRDQRVSVLELSAEFGVSGETIRRDLKDLEACLDTGRMPGLGAVAHSLRVLSWPERHDDSLLRKSWRSFLRGLPEPRRSAVRSREFDRLGFPVPGDMRVQGWV